MFASASSGFTAALSSIINPFIEIRQYCGHLQLYRDFENIVSQNTKGDKTIEDIESNEIEFKNVSFKYPRSKDYALNNTADDSEEEIINILNQSGLEEDLLYSMMEG